VNLQRGLPAPQFGGVVALIRAHVDCQPRLGSAEGQRDSHLMGAGEGAVALALGKRGQALKLVSKTRVIR
jgi:hypothetical protein